MSLLVDFSLQTVLFNISIAFCSVFDNNVSGFSLDVPQNSVCQKCFNKSFMLLSQTQGQPSSTIKHLYYLYQNEYLLNAQVVCENSD